MFFLPFVISLFIGIILHIDTIYGYEYDCECGKVLGSANPMVAFYNDTVNFDGFHDDEVHRHDFYLTGFCNGVRLSKYHVLTAESCFHLSNLACETLSRSIKLTAGRDSL